MMGTWIQQTQNVVSHDTRHIKFKLYLLGYHYRAERLIEFKANIGA